MCLRKEVLNEKCYECFLFVPNVRQVRTFSELFWTRWRRESDYVAKTKFVKSWDWFEYPERTSWKMFTYQKSARSNWWGDKSNVILQWLHINTLLLKLAGNVYVKIQANLRRIRMKSSEQTGAYIYPSICTIKLLFDKGTFFILFFLTLMNWSHTSFLYCLLSSLRG